MSPTPNALRWLALSAIIIALDQWTKAIALDSLTYLRPVVFIEGFWNWTLVHNYGAAFSFLSSAGGWQKYFFAGLAIGVSALLTFWLARTPRGDWRTALPFALIIGGALGNLIDRLRFGYVVDFVDWHWRGYHWPAFNIADSAIVAGAVAMVLFSFKAAPAAGKAG